jgi:heavy metal sensor kinase
MLILGIIILVADLYLYKSFKSSLIESIDDTLYMLAEEVEHTILKESPATWRKEIKNVRDEFITHRFFIQVLEIIESNEEKEIHRLIPSEVLAGIVYPGSRKNILSTMGDKPEYVNVTYKSLSVHPIRIILFPVITENLTTYIVQVGTSLRKSYQSLDKLMIVLAIAAPFMLIFSSLVGYLILTRAFKLVKSVVRTVRQISAEDLSLRVDSKGKADEIGELIDTFNRMIERLEQSVHRIKEFSSDVSHELKTPLTIMRGEMDVVMRRVRDREDYEKAFASVYEEVKKLETIIDDLLFLSQADLEQSRAVFNKTPLYEILINEVEKMKKLADRKNVRFIIKEIEALYINGDALLLERLIMNLIDNAVKYTPGGGEIAVSLKKDSDHALLKLQDNGIGIPGESLPYIFNRFYRVDKSRANRSRSSGLGLSIVRQVAILHGAEVNIESETGKGTRVTVRLPIFKS